METVLSHGPYRLTRNECYIKVTKNHLVIVNRTFETIEEAKSYFSLMADIARFLEG